MSLIDTYRNNITRKKDEEMRLNNEKTKYFQKEFFAEEPNLMPELLPDSKDYQDIIHVYDLRGKGIHLYSDIRNEKTVLVKDPRDLT